MNPWRPFPVLRIVIPFIAGIILSRITSAALALPWFLPAVGVILLWLAVVKRKILSHYRYRWLTGILINFIFFTSGWILTNGCHPKGWKDYFGKHPESTFTGIVSETASLRRGRIKTVLEVSRVREGHDWKPVRGKAIVYLTPHGASDSLQLGDVILFHARINEIPNTTNPHAFNYAAYLNGKGIWYQSYVSATHWKKLDVSSTLIIRRFSFYLRDQMLKILRTNEISGREFSVAAALLLGYTEEIDEELRHDYAATGAMHILSVSGMHVGIIYVFLEFMLSFLSRNPTGRVLKTIILLGAVWFYAFLTGLSPSVLRSAAMLSLPIVARTLNRPSDMINVIAVSLLVILAADPYLLGDVGFQLSYLAVLGITWLYPPIYHLFTVTRKIPDKIWAVVAVSLAAQLATVPLTLYYFHQFPNYFILTNIFVVPLSSLIIYTGIFVLAAASIPMVAYLSAQLLEGMIWLLNAIIHCIEGLPFSTLQDIYITLPDVLLMFAMIIGCFQLLTTRRATWVMVLLVFMVIKTAVHIEDLWKRERDSYFVVYYSRDGPLIRFSYLDRAVIFYDGKGCDLPLSLVEREQKVHADLKACKITLHRFLWLGSPEATHRIPAAMNTLKKSGGFFQFSGKTIALLTRKFPVGFKRNIPVDFLIITGDPKVEMEDIRTTFHPGVVIIDATNSSFRVSKWLAEAKKFGITCHAVSKQGAYEAEFSESIW